MNKRLSVARGLYKIKDLKPGSLFIFEGDIFLKSNKVTDEGHCECIVIGKGNVLEANDLNHIRVQPAELSDIPESEIK